jgi:hypothetical protein
MQAVLSVAWKCRREGLLTRQPRPLDQWLKAPNALLDPSTSFQQMCSEFKINYSIEYLERGPDHDRTFAAVLRFSDGPKTIAIRGRSHPARLRPSTVPPSRPLLCSTLIPPILTCASLDSSSVSRFWQWTLRTTVAASFEDGSACRT